MRRGRPLRFLGGVVAGWTGLRIALLWPDVIPTPLVAAAPVEAATRAWQRPISERPARRIAIAAPLHIALPALPPDAGISERAASAVSALIAATPLSTSARPKPAKDAPGLPSTEAQGPADPALPFAPVSPARPRLAGDAWLVLRPGEGNALAFGQLGASQGGARLTYALDPARRLALSARLSAPVRGKGAEAGIGLDLRPTRLPVHFLLEQRFGLDGGGTRPAAGLVAGVSTALPGQARLDAYGQGGAVWKRGGFVDGAALVARPVLERGRARVEIGGGAWGAAQRRVSRLDVGPAAALVLPTGGATLRLQFDYRHRIAGNARPGSGPALSLGGSF